MASFHKSPQDDRNHDNPLGYHSRSHQHKVKLPVIPDLRFEYSYLRSIRPYVHVERSGDHPVSIQQHSSVDELLTEYEKVEPHSSPEEPGNETAVVQISVGQDVVHVEWQKVLWVTTRDQVISPLLQGILWGVASYFLTPYSAQLGSKLGQLMHAKSPAKEGTGAGWLRRWVKSLGLTSKSVEERRR